MIKDNEIIFKNLKIEELIDRERQKTIQYCHFMVGIWM